MTNEEILLEAIERAVKNGWSDPTELLFIGNWKKLDNLGLVKEEFVKRIYNNLKWVALIFSHDFAKAFFGDDNIDPISIQFNEKDLGKMGSKFTLPGKLWQFQLMQMALADDPLKYLEKFL